MGQTPVSSILQRFRGDPDARDLYSIVHLAATIDVDPALPEVERREETLSIFGASVGYAQDRFIRLLEKDGDLKKPQKYAARDHMLVYGINVFTQYGHEGMMDYMLTQRNFVDQIPTTNH